MAPFARLARWSIAAALVVTSAPVEAQQSPSHAGASSRRSSASAPSMPSVSSAPPARSVGRAAAGAGLGLAGGVAGFALGFYAVAALPSADEDCGDACGVERLGWAAVGGGAVAIVGLSLGAYAGAEWVGGDGSLGWTLLGGLGGAAVAAGLGGLAARAIGADELTATLLVVPPLVGAVLGYELSAADASRTRRSSAVLGVAPAPGGAALGLSGTF